VIIRCIDDKEGLVGLAEGWNSLLRRSASDGLFLTWEWISTWWEIYGAEFELLVLAAEEDGQVVGIAPLMVGRAKAKLGRPLVYIGQGVDVTPEYLDLIVARGAEERVTAAFCRELLGPLRARWDVLELERMLSDSPNVAPLQSALGREGVVVLLSDEARSPYAELPRSWDAFLARKSPDFRRKQRYCLGRLSKLGEVQLLVAGRDLPVDDALEAIIRLNRDRWEDAGASFRSDAYIEFHRRFARLAEPRGWLALLLLRIKDTVVAGRYDFVYGGKLWCYQGGWRKDHARFSVGDAVLGMTIRWGIERGVREYDFLMGPAAYKDRWCTASRHVVDLTGYNTTGRAQAFRLLRQGRDLLRQSLSSTAKRARVDSE